MSDPITFFVAARPIPQGSKTGFSRPGSTFVNIVDANAKRLKPWRKLVSLTAIESTGASKIIEGPVWVKIVFVFDRPKSHFGTGRNSSKLKDGAPEYPTSLRIGDVDKLTRAILDGLSDANVYRDDSQVVGVVASKRYKRGADDNEGAWVTVSTEPYLEVTA